jgi:hypothetical protein
MAEALALKEGIILAQTMGCNRIILSSDNMDVIEVMQDGGNSSDVAAAIFNDFITLLLNFKIFILNILIVMLTL